MAITLRATSAVVILTGSPATITLNLPAGTVATDVLIASLGYLGGTGATISPPVGWTLIKRIDSTTSNGVATYWALGNVASLAFSLAGITKIVGDNTAYVGVDNTTPMDVAAAGQANASSTTWTAPSITTVTDLAWFLCSFGGASGSTFTIGAGLTDRGNGASAGSGTKNALDTGDSNAGVTPPGATGTHTTLASLTAVNVGITVALRPVVAAATVNINVTRLWTRIQVRRRKIVRQRPLPFIKAPAAAVPTVNINTIRIRTRNLSRKRRRSPPSKRGFVKAPLVAAPSININTIFPLTVRPKRRRIKRPRSQLGLVKAPPPSVPSVNINTVFIRRGRLARRKPRVTRQARKDYASVITRAQPSFNQRLTYILTSVRSSYSPSSRRLMIKKKPPKTRITILSFGHPTPVAPPIRIAGTLTPSRQKRAKKGKRKIVWLKPGYPTAGPAIIFNSFGSDVFYDPANYLNKNAIFFEAFMSATAGQTARARLFNITGNAAIAGSDITTTSTTLVRVRSGDIKANMPVSAVDMRAQRGGLAGDTPTIKSARLIIVEK